MKLAFLGSGNIARAIIGGLISHGARPSDITAADPVQAALDEVAKLGLIPPRTIRLRLSRLMWF